MTANEIAALQANTIHNLTFEGMKEIGDSFFEGLVLNNPNVRIPEPVFVQHFLPYFTGQVTPSKNDPTLVNWISVAGSPTAEVDVVDNAGRVLYTVPSLLDTTIVNPVKQQRDLGFSSVSAQANLYQNNIPAQATKFLIEALDDQAEQVLQPMQNKASINHQRWMHIFERYGVTPPNSNKNVVDTINDDHEELIYD